jgi:alpha-beta hydrolase superfamily lysophospholipase
VRYPHILIPVVDNTLVQEPGRPSTQPIVFGRSERPLFGFCHTREGGPTRSLAVVLCNPLGYEEMSVHRTYRHLAERLARRGFLALRFDYDGTGDSSGHSDDPGRVRAWLDSIQAAADEACARAGTRQLALFGVRLGATLAAQAAAERGDVECLVPWAPVVSGRAHVRELRAYRLIKPVKAAAPKTAQPTDGSEEIAGYSFSRETLTDMAALDLLARSERVARRALVLPRNERAVEETRLVDHLRARGTDARLGHDTSYGSMMRDDPYETVVPFATLDGIVDWLSEERYSERRAAPPSRPARQVLAIAGRPGKIGVVETPLFFGETKRLFGVITEPDGPVRGDRPALCFLNVGGNHHVGPHRMNVDLARDLASLGYVTFRFDVAGLGESRATPGTRENRIYTKDSVADVQSAMTLLGQARSLSRFVLFGLCSGAYLAFHTAKEDARVAGQVLLSSYAFEWKEGDSVTPTERKTYDSTRTYMHALVDYRIWLRAMKGEVDVRGIAGILLERLQTRVDSELPFLSARLRGQRHRQNDVERAFNEMCDRGVQSLLVSSFSDGGLDMITRYLGNDARKMRGRKEFTLEIPNGADHTFSSLASQKILSGIIKRYLNRHFP